MHRKVLTFERGTLIKSINSFIVESALFVGNELNYFQINQLTGNRLKHDRPGNFPLFLNSSYVNLHFSNVQNFGREVVKIWLRCI